MMSAFCFLPCLLLVCLVRSSVAIGQNSVFGSGQKAGQIAPDISRMTSQSSNDPLFNSLGDTCLQIGYPCDTYGSVCASQKTLFPQTRKAESSGRCKCRPGFMEVETACNRPPVFLKLPYKFHILSLSANQTVGIIRAKDPDNNPIELQLSTSEFTITPTGELLTTMQYSAPKTVTFSAVVTDNYGSEAIVPVTVTISVPEVKVKTSTTTPFSPHSDDNSSCSLPIEVCDTAPDASAFLLGPFQLFQTYLLFFGPYVFEYVMDWNTTDSVPKIRMQTEPDLITTYFNLTLDEPANVSVLFSYSSLTASGDTFLLNLILNISGERRQLRCSTDPSTSSRAIVGCQLLETEANGNFTLPGQTATSQLFIGDSQVYHYVISDAQNQSLALMDGNFSTTYQRNDSFLAGQSRITTVTAIQLIQDQLGGGDGRYPDGLLAVFGVNRQENGLAFVPYLGFAHLPLSGKPDIPLKPVDGSFSWVAEPQDLRRVLPGC